MYTRAFGVWLRIGAPSELIESTTGRENIGQTSRVEQFDHQLLPTNLSVVILVLAGPAAWNH